MKHRTGKTFSALALCLLLALTACSKEPAVQDPALPATTEPAAEASAQAQEPEKTAPMEEAPSDTAPSSQEEPAAPERTASYTLILSGEEQTVYLDVSDEEILLWDSASGGRMLAAARYAQAMPGAKEALRNCDFTDLDGDGNSELTADFCFEDGSTASLLWFYTDGGFVYNAEFSVLPGETSAAGEE